MIADGLTKVLTSTNYKAFIEMIGLEDQRKHLASIRLEKDQRDVFLFCGAEQNSKALRYGAKTS